MAPTPASVLCSSPLPPLSTSTARAGKLPAPQSCWTSKAPDGESSTLLQQHEGQARIQPRVYARMGGHVRLKRRLQGRPGPHAQGCLTGPTWEETSQAAGTRPGTGLGCSHWAASLHQPAHSQRAWNGRPTAPRWQQLSPDQGGRRRPRTHACSSAGLSQTLNPRRLWQSHTSPRMPPDTSNHQPQAQNLTFASNK